MCCVFWVFPNIIQRFKFSSDLDRLSFYNFGRCKSQADSRLYWKFAYKLETSPYFLQDLQIVFNSSIVFQTVFCLQNNSKQCVLISYFFALKLSVLSYCDILQCLTLKLHHLFLPDCMATIQFSWNNSIFPSQFQDFQADLPDFFLLAFGSHCSPQFFWIVGNLPGSIATPLPGF